jgi:molecular chaperone DnaK (HSP70)
MTSNNGHKRQVAIGVGFDIGTGFSSISIMSNGRLKSIKLPVDGDQVPSAVFIDTDGTTFVGNEALLRAWKNPSRLYTHFKPEMFNAPDESVNGGPTRVELTGTLIKEMVSQCNRSVYPGVAS